MLTLMSVGLFTIIGVVAVIKLQ